MIKKIIKNLQIARKAKKLTQGELGSKMGLPQSHISQIESGNIDLRLSSFFEMARLLDLEPMLIPRHLTPVVRSIISGEKPTNQPAWQPDDQIDDEKEELS